MTTTLPARLTAASGHHSPHGITGESPALAKPAPADDADTGERGPIPDCNDALRLKAARTIFPKPQASP